MQPYRPCLAQKPHDSQSAAIFLVVRARSGRSCHGYSPRGRYNITLCIAVWSVNAGHLLRFASPDLSN